MTQLDLVFEGHERLRGRRVVASISGGRDSAAMSLYLRELGIEHERVFMDTGWESQITYDYIRGPLTAALGPITEIRGDYDFLSLVRRKGLFPSRVMRFCTEFLKVKPIQAYLAEQPDAGDVVNAVGIRRAESKARSRMTEWEWSDLFDCEIWRPIVAWSAQDVADIHARHALAMNPLYGLGASRVGCWPCIHARKNEIALVARLDPSRIDLVRETEQWLDERGAARDEQEGRAFVHRSMFSYGGGGRGHVAMPIDQALQWSTSGRGEWQPPGSGEGCMRHGLCETEADAS